MDTTRRRLASISRCLDRSPSATRSCQVRRLGALQREAAAQLLIGEQARLDRLGQLHLVFGGQQRDAPDLPQVDPDQVAGGGGRPEIRLPRGSGLFHLLVRSVDKLDALITQQPHDIGERVG